MCFHIRPLLFVAAHMAKTAVVKTALTLNGGIGRPNGRILRLKLDTVHFSSTRASTTSKLAVFFFSYKIFLLLTNLFYTSAHYS